MVEDLTSRWKMWDATKIISGIHELLTIGSGDGMIATDASI